MAGKRRPTDDLVEDTPASVVEEPVNRKAPNFVTIDMYFSIRSIQAGHHAGRIAYAAAKGSTQQVRKTVEEWDGVFASY